MPINAHPEFIAAEGEYHKAQTLDDKIDKLKKMISLAPAHKGGENLRAQLKVRLKKLQEQQIKNKKKKGSQKGIKKADMQAILVGKTNSGKSSLLKILTNANPIISSIKFQTKEPQIGMMNYATTQIQIIENPAIDSPDYDKGLTNTADTIIIVATNLEDIEKISAELKNTDGKKIIAFNKIDLLDSEQKRKLEATLNSKKYNYALISTRTEEGIEILKGKIFQSFEKIRVYTKEPEKKEPDRNKPVILPPKSSVKDVAEKILHGFSNRVKQVKIWGPSAKFSGQKVGLNHILKDNDIVEFRTR